MKNKIKQAVKIAILYGSACLVAGFVLDMIAIWAILAVQLPQNAPKCQKVEISTSTPKVEPEPEQQEKLTNQSQTRGTIREATAYNSVEGQTDSTPCVGADGTDLCKRYEKGECLVATNAYRLGTKLEIQGFGKCTVADRMNKRYKNRVDIFMNKDITRAKAFGVQRLLVAEAE